MKLKTGIYWRSSDHKACGFASCSSTMSLTDSIRDMIQDEENEHDEIFQEKYAPAIYVNQWRFQSTYNVIHNAEFFFNTGSLDGNDMLQHQLIHVILSYELIGVQILGLVSNAGGNNAGLIRLLQSGQQSKNNQPETNAALASFSNPFDPSRRIAIWLCSTHNLKSMRNQLMASAGSCNSTRLFFRNGSMFGWNQICEVYDREEIRKQQGTTGQTRMKYAAAHPDSFSKMSAAFAKIPFCYDVIMEQTLYLVGLIGKHEELMALLTSTMKGGSNYATLCSVSTFEF